MSLNNLSSKNIYRIFHDIYVNHRQLQDFGTGDIYRVNGRTQLEHPTLWVDLQSATIEESIITVSAQIYIFDLTDSNEWSEKDIQSNTLLLINDVVTLLRTHYELIDPDFVVNSQFFTHDFNDRVAGWFVNVELVVPTTYGDCDMAVENLQGFPPGNDEDPVSAPITEFLLASPSKLWRITINDDGNLQSQEVI